MIFNQNRTSKLLWQIPAFILFLILLGNLTMLFVLNGEKLTGRMFLYGSLNSVIVGGIFAIGITSIVHILDREIPWLQAPVKRLTVQFFATVIFSLIVISLAIPLTGFFMDQQITSAYFIQTGYFMLKIAFFFIIVSSLITNAILFFKNWKEAAVQQEILKREQLALQYETLKSQVNPHFLFNNLNSLTSLISIDPDKAIHFVKKLSEVYRYVLDQKDHELVDLETELKFVESYIYLQKIRFENNLEVKIDVQTKNLKVIPLSVQMLVENAIKHNEISDKNPMQISIFTTNNQFLVVENKLQKKTGTEGNGSGIQNISDRYKFFTDKQVEIAVNTERFRISIPLLTD